MIELRNCILNTKGAPKNEVNTLFEAGQINHISHKQKYIFELLRLKNQTIKSGEFIIDDFKAYPLEDDTKSIFFLAINSLVKVGVCFLVESQEKDNKLKEVQEELLKLKELDCTSDLQKDMKIAAIFDVVFRFSPKYMLVDLSDEDNKSHQELIKQIDKYCLKNTIIVLDDDVEETEEAIEEETSEVYMLDLNIGENTSAKYVKETKPKTKFFGKNEKVSGSALKTRLVSELKNDAMVYLAFILPTLGMFTFSLLAPLYAKVKNTALLVVSIIVVIIFIALHFVMTYMLTKTNYDKEDKIGNICFLILNSAVSVISYAASIGIYFLLKNIDSQLKAITDNKIGIIISIIFLLLVLSTNIYICPLVEKIKSLIKKK